MRCSRGISGWWGSRRVRMDRACTWERETIAMRARFTRFEQPRAVSSRGGAGNASNFVDTQESVTEGEQFPLTSPPVGSRPPNTLLPDQRRIE
jgi:hypothetical protein